MQIIAEDLLKHAKGLNITFYPPTKLSHRSPDRRLAELTGVPVIEVS
jgi:hypothetical protein